MISWRHKQKQRGQGQLTTPSLNNCSLILFNYNYLGTKGVDVNIQDDDITFCFSWMNISLDASFGMHFSFMVLVD